MKKINIIFSSLLLAVSLLVTSVAQAKDIKIGVSFRMLSDVGYKHGELIPVSYTHLTLPTICSV